MEKLGQRLKPRLRDIGRSALSYFQENILLETPRNHPADFEMKVQDMMREGRYWPILLGTHKSHPAGFPLIEEAEYIARIANPFLPDDGQITGSLLLVANTMEKGQGDEIVKGFKLAEPIFQKYNMEPLSVLRKKDAVRLGEGEKREYQKQLFRKLGKVVESGQVPIVLPEATVESGRQKPGGAPGDIKGMVYLEPDSVAFLAQMIRRQKKEPLFFFVGTTGENRIYDPITEKVTAEAQMTAVKRSIPFGERLAEPIMKSVVDYPLSLTQIEQVYGENGKLPADALEWICGHLLARLLPYHERGVFADAELDDFDAAAGRRETNTIF